MPTYDYVCRACGHAFELFQSMNDPVKRKCPKCGASRLERLIGTGAGVIFKGSGFYATDYRSEKYRKAAEAESKPGSASGGGGETKSPAGGSGGGESSKSSSGSNVKPASNASASKSDKATPVKKKAS